MKASIGAAPSEEKERAMMRSESPSTGQHRSTSRIKVLSVFGTRPEAIKMAPIVRLLRLATDRFTTRVCVTAQHRDMLDQVLRLFALTPDYDLDVMQDSQSPSQVAAAVLRKLEPILRDEAPHWVIVQGDTTTVMAASLAAFHARIKIAHVEAGLRTWDKFHPFPEEINRQVVSLVADLHFAPTERARRNLVDQGIPAQSVDVTGNTVIDTLQWVASQPFDPQDGPLASVAWNKRILLVTAHRRENFGRPIARICEALRRIALAHPDDLEIVYPVHPNPNVYAPVHAALASIHNVELLPPLDYQPLIHLLSRCHIVLTDSGGIQEEAPTFGKPVLVLREVTERPEGVEAGLAKLVGTDCDRIVEFTERLLNDHAEYSKMTRGINPYGDGRASERILEALVRASR